MSVPNSTPDGSETHWDYLIVGGGTAGCVMASRLSETAASVLLLEAGRDTPPDNTPADIRDTFPASYYNPAYMWPGITAYSLTPEGERRNTPFVQARVMGGGSSLMGMIALRGLPTDYDGWQSQGAQGWGWQDVLPFFNRLEHDHDHSGPGHGQNGPVHIQRRPPQEWPPFCQAMARASASRGLPLIEDFNTDFRDGYGAYPISATATERVSSASAYLNASVRQRPNLSIRAHQHVERLLFEGQRCVGVEAIEAGHRVVHRARHVVLSAGAIHTPALMMRSGLGSADEMTQQGIDIVANLPGVGRNLQNHVIAYLGAHLKPEARQGQAPRSHFITCQRLSSPAQAPDSGDLLLLVLPKSAFEGLGTSIAALGVALYQPSGRGRVSLSPSGQTMIDFSYLADRSDRDRMIWGLSRALELMDHDAVRRLRNECFAAGYSDKVRRFNQPGWRNRLLSALMMRSLDLSDLTRRWVLEHLITQGELTRSELGSRRWLEETVDRLHFGMYHPVGTCRMGDESDPLAVVTPHGFVRGVRGLSIADASVMPRIPRANTNIPTQMVAEKLAHHLRHAPTHLEQS